MYNLRRVRSLFALAPLPIALGFSPASLGAQEVPFGIGNWDPDSLGNHRAVVRVDVTGDAVRVRIPWRRRDQDPEIFTLFSLGTEILSSGPGGGAPWLQEHLNGDYIAGLVRS